MIGVFRVSARRRLHLAIDIAGLAFGLATFLSFILVARYELGWDHAYRDPQSLYRLSFQVDWGAGTAHTFTGLPREIEVSIRKRQPDIPISGESIETGTVSSETIPERLGTRADIYLVEPGYLNLLGFRLAAGDRTTALSNPNGMILSKAMAQRYFPHASAMGRTIHVLSHEAHKAYVVTGILADLPQNLSVRPDFIVPAEPFTAYATLADDALSFGETTWFRANTQAARARVQAEAEAAFAASNLSRMGDGFFAHRTHFRTTPITHVHFGENGISADGTSRGIMLSLLAVGVLALVAAGINHVNLATAQAMGRAREVAIRKALGATRRRLILRYLAQDVGIAALAVLPGLALTEVAIPLIARASGWPITLDPAWSLPVLACVVLGLGIGAGLYPALIFSSFPMAQTLASVRMPAQGPLGAKLRTALVGVQFAFAVTLGICALVVSAEGFHLRKADRGLRADGLISVTHDRDEITDAHEAAILAFLRGMPGVTSVTLSNKSLREQRGDRYFTLQGREKTKIGLLTQPIDPAFFPTFGATLLAGRTGDPARSDDHLAGSEGDLARNVVIDMQALHRLGFADPQAAIGKRLPFKTDADNPPMTVIGVVNTIRYGSGREAPHGTIYSLRNEHLANGAFTLRAAPSAVPDVMLRLRAAWPTLAPGVPFAAIPATDIFNETTRQDLARGQLLSLGAASAIAIAALGLYGLASFNVASRLHEIGIRKTLGASTLRIMVLLLGQFLRPVLMASLVAWPLAFLLMRGWLAGFADRVALSPLYFLAATMLACALCCCVVFGRSARLAWTSAAVALRAG